MSQKKNTRRLIGLASAAVLCVSGYAVVKSNLPAAQASPSATHHAAVKHKPAVTHKKAPAHHATPATKTKTKATKKATVAKVAKQKYKDGTYTGVGTTPIGSIQVQLTLKKDKITNVQITGASTHYPVSFIDPVLNDELLARQDPNKLDVVSGATLSTYDFYYAVVSALKQAAAAEAKVRA